MFIHRRFALLLALAVPGACLAAAQPSSLSPQSSDDTIKVDVVVSSKSGPPRAGLQQKDFTLLDNKLPQTITSFRALDPNHAPVEATLVIDALNIGYTGLSSQTQDVVKFLRAGQGHLALPTAVTVFSEKGFTVLGGPTRDGNALAEKLAHYDFSLRTVRRSQGFYGAAERYQLSVDGLRQLAADEAARPGRKLILWISPGWPLLSGPNIELDDKQQSQLFANVVDLSNRLREAQITLYSIDSLGVDENLGRTLYYQNFVKGVAKPSQVQVGNLALQVLAVQSGGLALSSTGVAGLLERCVADAGAYYELSFHAPRGEPNQFHQLAVQVDESTVEARTRDGYYGRP